MMNVPRVILCTLPITAPSERQRFLDKQHGFRGPRLGVQVIRDYLVQAKFPSEHVSFLDIEMLALSDQELAQYFGDHRPEIVGLSAVLSHSYLQVKRISRIIRNASPDTYIVVGGNLSASAHVVLRKTDVDVCIVGDGEAAFLELVNYVRYRSEHSSLESLGGTKGICVLDETNDLIFGGYATKPKNEFIPLPDYQFFKSGLMNHEHLVNRYFTPVEKMGMWFSLDPRTHEPGRRRNVAQFFTSKGCTARCTFCQRNTRGYRLANLTDIEAHLQMLINDFDVGFISCMDENFGSRREHARAFADLMDKYGLLWTATGVRCVNVNREDIEYFKSRGCCSLKFGVESGSQVILDSMEKNFNVSDVKEALKACWDNSMYSPLALMVGMPGEGKDTIKETGEFIGKLSHELGVHPDNQGYALFYALPFPGTPLYDHCTQIGLIGTDLDSEEHYLARMANGLTDKWHYLNVNGAKPAEIVSWDHSVEWYARKMYTLLGKKDPRTVSDFARSWSNSVVERNVAGFRHKLNVRKVFSLFFVLSVLSKTYRSRFVTRLPAKIALPYIKYSQFSAITIYRIIGRLLGQPTFSLYEDQSPSEVFKRPDLKSKRLEKSLRHLVHQKRKESPDENSQVREKLLIGNAG